MTEDRQTNRTVVPALELLIGETIKVHEHGLVRVIDYMGGDESIVQMARVSYGKGTKKPSEDRGLIRYLLRNRHTSPIEGCEIKLHLKMPIFVARQWVRHRTASMNEISARYSEMKDEFFVPLPNEVEMQSKSNKQGSQVGLDTKTQKVFAEYVDANSVSAFSLYEDALGYDVAREMARIVLPLNLYTEFYWKIDLHNLLHFVGLRSDSHAQKEIRAYSDVILHQIIKAWTPLVYEACIDYVMEGKRFSRMELKLVKDLMREVSEDDLREEMTRRGLIGREADEFLNKIRA